MRGCNRRRPFAIEAWPHYAAVLVVHALSGCSTDVSFGEQFVHPDASVAGGAGGQSTGTDSAPGDDAAGGSSASTDGPDGRLTFDADVRDSRADAADGSVCLTNRAACVRGDDCCSGFCIGQACLTPGMCQASGATCTQSATCCSGRCEPPAMGTNLVCRPLCSADGVACTKAQDCCSLGCFNGVCGGGPCLVRGIGCAKNADCCSNICDTTTGLCRRVGDDRDECQPAGENCAGDAGITCCSGCDTTTGRCAFAATTCRGIGVTCASDSDCCKGKCSANGQNQLVCRVACAAEGVSCRANADCCTFNCSSGQCGPASARPDGGADDAGGSVCRSTGNSCTNNAQCCTSLCAAGFCDLPCQLDGVRCRVGTDCCSGVCTSNVCQPSPAP